MPYTPTGYLAVPPAALRATLAASATWQSLCQCPGDAASAALSIALQFMLDDVEDEQPVDKPKLKFPRPRAVIVTNEDFMRERRGAGEWHPQGTLNLSIELVVPDQYQGDQNEEFIWVASQIGGILSEMETLRDGDTAGTYLPFDRIAIVQDPMPGADDLHVEAFWGSEFQFFFQ